MEPLWSPVVARGVQKLGHPQGSSRFAAGSRLCTPRASEASGSALSFGGLARLVEQRAHLCIGHDIPLQPVEAQSLFENRDGFLRPAPEAEDLREIRQRLGVRGEKVALCDERDRLAS